ncbi:hypothetical protein F8388_011063, partial [Cannabis sativa]
SRFLITRRRSLSLSVSYPDGDDRSSFSFSSDGRFLFQRRSGHPSPARSVHRPYTFDCIRRDLFSESDSSPVAFCFENIGERNGFCREVYSVAIKCATITPDKEVDNLGVKAALCVLKFYKSEISPILPKSCRFVPTCSEYSMEAYKKYGFVKGTLLTTWRICRCNPLGGSGFDPPRWFDETSLPEE